MCGASILRSVVSAFALYLTISATAPIKASAQSAASQKQLSLKTILVQSPEFCATKMPKGGRVEVGKLACVDFEPALRDIFSSLTISEQIPKPGDLELILIPAFVDLAATTGKTAFSDRKLDVYLTWTAKDASGNTVWIETVHGSATHRAGTAFSYSKNFKLMLADAVRDLASQSAMKMSASPELRKLSE